MKIGMGKLGKQRLQADKMFSSLTMIIGHILLERKKGCFL